MCSGVTEQSPGLSGSPTVCTAVGKAEWVGCWDGAGNDAAVCAPTFEILSLITD